MNVDVDRVTTESSSSQPRHIALRQDPLIRFDDAQDLLVAVQERLLVLARAVRSEVHGLTSVVREEHSVANLDTCGVWIRGTDVRI